jgi:hypothetical protein
LHLWEKLIVCGGVGQPDFIVASLNRSDDGTRDTATTCGIWPARSAGKTVTSENFYATGGGFVRIVMSNGTEL